MISSWFFLSTLNYDALSTTHQIYQLVYGGNWFTIASDILWKNISANVTAQRPECDRVHGQMHLKADKACFLSYIYRVVCTLFEKLEIRVNLIKIFLLA